MSDDKEPQSLAGGRPLRSLTGDVRPLSLDELLRPARAVVIAGVSGSGKTTVGTHLAQRLGARFLDADDFHPAANIAKMARGEPLDDNDRRPWLAALNQALAMHVESGESVVLACSALKRTYRDRLTAGLPDAVCVLLSASREVLQARVSERQHRFMPASLLDSQLATLEPLDTLREAVGRWAVDTDRPVADILDDIVTMLGTAAGAQAS